MSLEEQLAIAGALPQQQQQPVQQAVQPQPVDQQSVQVDSVLTSDPVGTEAFAQTQVQEVPQPTQTVVVTQAPQALQVTPQFASQQIIDLDEAQKQAELDYYHPNIKLGERMSLRPIDPVKMSAGDKFRCHVISIDPQYLHCAIHQVEGLPKILCNKKYCCERLGTDTLKARYYFPVLIYPTFPNDPNQINPNGKAELKLLIIWDFTAYEAICDAIKDVNYDLSKVDFKVNVTDNFQRLSIQPTQSISNQFAPQIEAATAQWDKIKNVAASVVARPVTPERLDSMLSSVTVPKMANYTMEDIEY